MRNRYFWLVLVFHLSFSSNLIAQGDESSDDEKKLVLEQTIVTTDDILGAPVGDASCHNYCVLGVCFWLRCSFFSCSVETSVRVGHNNPDLVVSVYDIPGDNPHQEAEELYGDIEESSANSLVNTFHVVEAGQGHRVEGGNPYTNHSLRYAEATAVGNPLLAVENIAGDTGYYCPSEAEVMRPYFSSGFDALSWRLGLFELLYVENFLPGVRVIGEGGYFQQWGPVFTRTGFVQQKDWAKASAVIAQRVGNIVTQTDQPHIYQALDGNNYNKSWLPGELVENDADTGVWQMVAPYQDDKCYAFGENDVYKRDWSHRRTSEDNRYVYNLWRPYACCDDQGAYLYKVDIPPVCVPSF